jgi:hypothetical protein
MLLNSPVQTQMIRAKCSLFHQRWQATCGGSNFIRRGMLLNWIDLSAPDLLRQNSNRREYKADRTKASKFLKLLQDQIKQGIVFQVHHNFVAHYNPSFLVPKGMEWRMILDCQILNMLLRIIHFKMEGPENLTKLAQENDFATSQDIKSAFNHITIHPSFQPFL